MLLDDLGNPPPGQLARVLGVSVSTVARWQRSGKAPRSALLALFWLTRWGRSVVAVDLLNEARTMRALAESRAAQVRALRRRLEMLEQATPTGAANSPFFDPLRPLQATGAGLRPTVA